MTNRFHKFSVLVTTYKEHAVTKEKLEITTQNLFQALELRKIHQKAFKTVLKNQTKCN